MHKPYLILCFLWALYCFLHSMLASLWFKGIALKFLGHFFKFYRVFYSCIAIVLLLAIFIYQFSIKELRLFKSSVLIEIIAIGFTITGIVIMAVCSRKYFRFITGFQIKRIESDPDKLYTSGINNIVRHPLYGGTIIFIWSLFALLPFISNLIFCLVITIYIFIGIKLEERKLLIKYGSIYKAYSLKVPMIIPNFQNSNKAH